LAASQDEFRKWLNDPQKLLELIAGRRDQRVGELPGLARVGQCPQESPAKQEALELGQVAAADRVPVSDLAMVAGQAARTEE